ncbi:indole-3-glycerol phosphate synthase TrpC [Chlamydiota bacterium]
METILGKIVTAKKKRLELLKKEKPVSTLLKEIDSVPRKRSFLQAIRGKETLSIIGELKKASPSKGELLKDFDPSALAKIYTSAGIDAISVLTEEDFFKGDDTYLSLAKDASTLPVLRKDFIIDQYQILESRVYGADAVLLICRILSDSQLEEFMQQAAAVDLDVLVEVHTALEVKRALNAGAQIIGINNRNLSDFSIDLTVTTELCAEIPSIVTVVSESGFSDAADLGRVKNYGVDAVLVGEAFMKSATIEKTIKEFVRNV